LRLGDQPTGWAQAIDVPESRINAIRERRRAITADTDLAPLPVLGRSEGFPGCGCKGAMI